MTRRSVLAVMVLGLWLAGLGALVRREFFRPQIERLAEAAMRVNPGAVFYAVFDDGRQVGFASSTIDTSTTAITVSEYLLADVPQDDGVQRMIARTDMRLTRGLRLRSVETIVDRGRGVGPARLSATIDEDTVLAAQRTVDATRSAVQRVSLDGPVLLPEIVRLAVVLAERPRVGRRYTLPMLDSAEMASRDGRFVISAESLFVVNDSAAFDSIRGRWVGTWPDTIRAWQVDDADSGSPLGWVDAQGRVVKAQHLGFTLLRQPYELAVENWRLDGGSTLDGGRDAVQHTTLVSANALRRVRSSAFLLVRVAGLERPGSLAGGRQSVRGDTVVVVREGPERMRAGYRLPDGGIALAAGEASPEPLIESDAAEIVEVARRVRGSRTDPLIVATSLSAWMRRTIASEVVIGTPSALEVLRSGRGDVDEHARLFVALARAAGIPARVARGVVAAGETFHYHAWPEILLDDWVAVDPILGQFPASAGRVRLGIGGGVDGQTAVLRSLGTLRIHVLDTR